MHKRFRKSAEQTNIFESSSSNDEATANLQKNRSLVARKYMRIKRREIAPVHISDTSSDEANTPDQLEQENRKWLPNLKRYSSDSKALPLTPQNKFQPLSLSVSAKSPSPNRQTDKDLWDIPRSAPAASPATCRAAWHSFRKTLATVKRGRPATISNCSKKPQNESMDDTLLDCSLATSIEANLETMIDTQLTPNRARTAPTKKRCIKGGYVQEFKRLMLRERMDRRSLAHNQRLGLSSGQRVRVLDTCASFGVCKARVQDETEKEQDKGIFNIIISPNMAGSICVGSTLELYFDLNADSALLLPNKELVYVQPNKIVLL